MYKRILSVILTTSLLLQPIYTIAATEEYKNTSADDKYEDSNAKEEERPNYWHDAEDPSHDQIFRVQLVDGTRVQPFMRGDGKATTEKEKLEYNGYREDDTIMRRWGIEKHPSLTDKVYKQYKQVGDTKWYSLKEEVTIKDYTEIGNTDYEYHDKWNIVFLGDSQFEIGRTEETAIADKLKEALAEDKPEDMDIDEYLKETYGIEKVYNFGYASNKAGLNIATGTANKYEAAEEPKTWKYPSGYVMSQILNREIDENRARGIVKNHKLIGYNTDAGDSIPNDEIYKNWGKGYGDLSSKVMECRDKSNNSDENFLFIVDYAFNDYIQTEPMDASEDIVSNKGTYITAMTAMMKSLHEVGGGSKILRLIPESDKTPDRFNRYEDGSKLAKNSEEYYDNWPLRLPDWSEYLRWSSPADYEFRIDNCHVKDIGDGLHYDEETRTEIAQKIAPIVKRALVDGRTHASIKSSNKIVDMAKSLLDTISITAKASDEYNYYHAPEKAVFEHKEFEPEYDWFKEGAKGAGLPGASSEITGTNAFTNQIQIGSTVFNFDNVRLSFLEEELGDAAIQEYHYNWGRSRADLMNAGGKVSLLLATADTRNYNDSELLYITEIRKEESSVGYLPGNDDYGPIKIDHRFGSPEAIAYAMFYFINEETGEREPVGYTWMGANKDCYWLTDGQRDKIRWYFQHHEEWDPVDEVWREWWDFKYLGFNTLSRLAYETF